MKKFLLIPTIAAITAAPLVGLCSCSCNSNHNPEPTPPSEETFVFSFNGQHCTINEQEIFTDKVDADETNVVYTVIPSADYEIEMPSPKTGMKFEMKENRLIITIEAMNSDYSIDVNAKPAPESEFTFSFAGTNCTINEQETFADKVDANETNVIYTVVPYAGHKIVMPSPKTGMKFEMKENRLVITIEVMNDNYSIDVSAEPASEGEFTFSFAGDRCTINEQETFTDNVDADKTNVKYTVIPYPNHTIVMPSPKTGMTFEKKEDRLVITITVMDDDYSINVNATPNEEVDQEIMSITAESGTGVFSVTKEGQGEYPDLYYSTNDGETWNEYDWSNDGQEITLTEGSSLLLAGNNSEGFSNSKRTCTINYEDGTCSVSGSVMSLIDNGTDTMVIPDYNCFARLFADCSTLVSIDDDFLPAVDLNGYCYSEMFQNCSGLTDVSNLKLPADYLSERCYNNMFMGCVQLTKTPILNAMHLAQHCYFGMFSGCTVLETAPVLPATRLLGEGCYNRMFYNCDGLVTAPDLPADQLTPGCYSYMFANCAKLINPPELNAPTLQSNCYIGMFSGCPELEVAPVLPALYWAKNAYSNMFLQCSKLKSLTVSALDLGDNGSNNGVFSWLSQAGTSADTPTIYITREVWENDLSWLRQGSRQDEWEIPGNWTIPEPPVPV